MTDTSHLRSRVHQFLAREFAPALGMDGTAIEVVDIVGGVAQVRLAGGVCCSPGSVMAIIMGLEQELRRQIPEIEYLEIVP